eukprot:gene11097-28228_t
MPDVHSVSDLAMTAATAPSYTLNNTYGTRNGGRRKIVVPNHGSSDGSRLRKHASKIGSALQKLSPKKLFTRTSSKKQSASAVKPKMIYFLHLHKHGGTSMRESTEDYFNPSLPNHLQHEHLNGQWVIFQFETGRMTHVLQGRQRRYAANEGSLEDDPLFPQKQWYTYVVLLRDPVEALLSGYSMSQRGQVVAGFMLTQTLGEGSYGKVKLGVQMETKDHVAVKIIERSKIQDKEVRKEVCIHKMLRHVNVTKFQGVAQSSSAWFMILELAVGGELYDRIEVDRGITPDAAHFYFTQLISAKLDKKCGTPPYTAPEIFAGEEYQGNLTDIWSCAVVLVALAAGRLPWDQPTSKCPEYKDWQPPRAYRSEPWRTIMSSVPLFGLLRKILHPDPRKRATLTTIQQDAWFTAETAISGMLNRHGLVETLIPMLQVKERADLELTTQVRSPGHAGAGAGAGESSHKRRKTEPLPGTVAAASASASAPQTPAASLQHTPLDEPSPRIMPSAMQQDAGPETIESLTWALVKVGIKDADILVKLDRLTIIVTTTDGRDDELDFACRCYPRAEEEKITVDFRLTRGDGIEFKRKFMEMCDILFDRYKDDRKMKACTELQPAALGRQ